MFVIILLENIFAIKYKILKDSVYSNYCLKCNSKLCNHFLNQYNFMMEISWSSS